MSDVPPMATTATATASPGEPFHGTVKVRFADCDPAGIVFYPRYFEMFAKLVEDWFESGVGTSFRELHLERGLGLPTVHIETDFLAPCEIGEILSAELSVVKLGRGSILLSISLRGPMGEVRVRGNLVLVLMDLQRRRAIPIPEELRRRIIPFCVE